MNRSFKRRYVKTSFKDQKKKILLSVFLVLIVITTLGYSLYRVQINNVIKLSINRPVFTITLNNQSANSAGTGTVYVKYLNGYYLNSNLTNMMTTSSNGITIPTKTGYVFRGYYTGTDGLGSQVIDSNGKVVSGVSTTSFTSNGSLYAYWIRVTASNVSYDNSESSVECDDTQCMIDYLADQLNNPQSSDPLANVDTIYRWSSNLWSNNIQLSNYTAGTDYVTSLDLVTNMNSKASKYYLKYNINNNQITNKYVCFVVTNSFANEYDVNAGTYCLKGGDGGASYVTNAKRVYDAFGSNCSKNPYQTSLSSTFTCDAGDDDDAGYGILLANDGYADVIDGSVGCFVESDGSSACNGDYRD